jgi:isocitrate dehydrogenase
MLSVHLKATMMKVSDPIVFGHAVRAFLGDVMTEHADALARAAADPDDGIGAMLEPSRRCRTRNVSVLEGAIHEAFATGPRSPTSTRTEASRTSTCRATSSSMPRCRR